MNTSSSTGAPCTGREPNHADRHWLALACEPAALCPPSETAFSVGAVIVAADGTELAPARAIPTTTPSRASSPSSPPRTPG